MNLLSARSGDAGAVRTGISVLAALSLAGCATPQVLTRSCITPSQLEELKKQAPPTVREKLTGRADEDVKILAANLLRRRAYEGLLIDTLTVCSQAKAR